MPALLRCTTSHLSKPFVYAGIAVLAVSSVACTNVSAGSDHTESSEAAYGECPSGGTCVKLSSKRTLRHMFASEGTVFGEDHGAIIAIPTEGGADQKLATIPQHDEVLGLTASSTDVYVLTHAGQPYNLVSIPRSGGTPTLLSQANEEGWGTSGEPAPMAIHNDTLYWGECGGVVSAHGYVKSLSLTTPGATPQIVARTGCPRSIGVDATHVYWARGGGYTGTGIERAPLAGGSVDHLDGSDTAKSIFIDAGSLYWSDGVGGTFRRSLDPGSSDEKVAGYSERILAVRTDGIVYMAMAAVYVTPFGSPNVVSQIASSFPDRMDATVGGNVLYWSNPWRVFSQQLP